MGDSDPSTSILASSPATFRSIRLIVLFLTTVTLTFCLGNPLILNFTVICMDDIIPANTTEEHWLQSSAKRNLLFSASAFGNLIGTFPISIVIEKFGTRKLFLYYGLLSAAATGLFPLVVQTNIYYLIFAARVVQGFSAAFTVPASTAVCYSWAAVAEFGFYISFLTSHLQLAAIFTMPASGALCTTSFGWRGAFYLQATATLILLAIFYAFYTDDPARHKMVTESELSRITSGKQRDGTDRKVPYVNVLRTPAIIGVCLSAIGSNLGYHLLVQFGPTYLNKVLKFEVSSTGFATALPYVLAVALKLFAGPMSDHATCISEKARMIMFASISQGCMAVCYVIMAWTANATLSQVSYTSAIVFSGLNIVGIIRCAQLVARQHMHFVMSVLNVIACTVSLSLPPVVALFVEHNLHEEWSRIFYTAAVIVTASNAVFFFVASAEPASWTETDYASREPLKRADCYEDE